MGCSATLSIYSDLRPYRCDGTTADQSKRHFKPTSSDCPDPVCQATSDMFAQAIRGEALASKKKKESIEPPVQCPLDVNALGKSAWDLIHTMAAYYPEEPSEEQQSAAIKFFQTLSLLYPCHICAEDFQYCVANNPPR